MPLTYCVVVEVRSQFQVEVEARDREEAMRLAGSMQSTDVREKGRALVVETDVVDVDDGYDPDQMDAFDESPTV